MRNPSHMKLNKAALAWIITAQDHIPQYKSWEVAQFTLHSLNPPLAD